MDRYSLINDLTSKIANEPENAELFYERSYTYLHYDYYDEAALDCSRALELEPDNMNYKSLQSHIKYSTEEAQHFEENPADNIRVLLGWNYISLLTPDADGYMSPLSNIGEFREEMKNTYDIDVPLIRFMDSDLIADSEVAIWIHKVIVWKYELKGNDLVDCENAILNELKNIFKSRV